MSTTVDKCKDCDRDVMPWTEFKSRLPGIVAAFSEQVDKAVTDRHIDLSDKLHEHEHLEAFVAWMVAFEKIDVRGLLRIVGESTNVRIVVMPELGSLLKEVLGGDGDKTTKH